MAVIPSQRLREDRNSTARACRRKFSRPIYAPNFPLSCALKGKSRLRETVRLLVISGTGVEESHKGPKLVFRAEDVGADEWVARYVCVVPSAFFGLAGQCEGVFYSR